MLKKTKAIITGATGMVGEGVLHEALLDSNVESVLVINRKPCGINHPKLKEIIHADFFDLSAIEQQLQRFNAYTLTLNFASTLSKLNNDICFCYVSGAGTNSSEKGGSNWSRVKGKTENDLMQLHFNKVFAFRPGFIKPTEGLKNTLSFYKYINWLFPIGRALAPDMFCTLSEIGRAMLHCVNSAENRKVLEGKDIIAFAKLL